MNAKESLEKNPSQKEQDDLGKLPQRRRNLSPRGASNPHLIPRSGNRFESLSPPRETLEQDNIQSRLQLVPIWKFLEEYQQKPLLQEMVHSLMEEAKA